MLSLLALAIAPGTAIALYVYSRDKYDREPLRPLLISFVLGMAAMLPTIFLEGWLQPLLFKTTEGYTLPYVAILAFFVVACTEEGCKFAVLRTYAYPHKAFNEPFDGIIYSVMISMGFATLENIGYVLEYGYKTGFVRMFLSVPSHAAFGVLMGYEMGLAKFNHHHTARYMIKGLLLAIVFHGAFDFFLLLQGSSEMKRLIPNKLLLNGMVATGVLLCYGLAIRWALRSIRLHEALSKQTYETNKTVPVS
jgi:RsiW-degrading membrane proteinase PrsW (M82 family)